MEIKNLKKAQKEVKQVKEVSDDSNPPLPKKSKKKKKKANKLDSPEPQFVVNDSMADLMVDMAMDPFLYPEYDCYREYLPNYNDDSDYSF